MRLIISYLGLLFALIVLSSCRTSTSPKNYAHPPAIGLPAFGIQFQDVIGQSGIDFRLGHAGKSPLNIVDTIGHGIALIDCDGDGLLDIVFTGPDQVRLYKNLGNWKFKDITAASGLRQKGYWQCCAVGDVDNDGRPDLYLANDETQADLLGLRHGKFVNDGLKSGTAFGGPASLHGGMGADWGDYQNNGKLDLVVATFAGETKCVYHNLGEGMFQEVSDSLALTPPVRANVTFGVKWIDYDNDGWLDLILANGHVHDNIAAINAKQTYRQHTQLFHNDKGKLLVEITNKAGTGLRKPIVGRGVAIGDFDNDGRMDALVVDIEGAPLLLHNESTSVGHWLLVKLIGTKSNRDGIGATVTAAVGKSVRMRLCHTDGSYLSASDVRVHIGLGDAAKVDTLTIHWPSGNVSVMVNVKGDQLITVRE